VIRLSAGILWLALGIAASTGCIPVVVPVVQHDITTGEKLRAIDYEMKRSSVVAKADEDEAAVKKRTDSIAWCTATRRRLLDGPVSMFAYVYDESGRTPENYSFFHPGLYAPEDRERIDLKRALDAGAITRAEFDELTLAAGIQARRYLVRHGFETAIVALYVHTGYNDRAYVGGDVGDRNRWLEHGWIRQQQQQSPEGDPNMPTTNPAARNFTEGRGGTAFYMEPRAAVGKPVSATPP